MIPRLFKYATRNILRNTFLSASSVLILTLLMFFINILVVMHDVSFRIIEGINQKLTISLYLDEGYDSNSVEVIDLQADIDRAIPGIDITYKSKEQVLDEIRDRDPELVSILERQNPLPETITLENIGLSDYQTLNRIIENKLFVLSDAQEFSWGEDEYFSTYTRQFERIDQVISILDTLRWGLYVVIATFVVSIAIIVYSIIGNFIYYYRDEIYITRLVGGSKIFIYGPFSLQGMMYVTVAFIIATVFFILFLQNIQLVFELGDIDEVYTGSLPLVFLIEAWVFLFVWGLSGFFSSRRYIKKNK